VPRSASVGARADVYLPRVRDWVDANSWVGSDVVLAFFLVITVAGRAEPEAGVENPAKLRRKEGAGACRIASSRIGVGDVAEWPKAAAC
jgi:hypothetical protein